MDVPREFRFVAAACCWPASGASLDHLQSIAREAPDWGRVACIANRHRVAGLLLRTARQSGIPLPKKVTCDLARAAGEQTRQALAFAFEAGRLSSLLRARGIEPIFLKGAALAVLAYGEPGLRHAKDMDLLVREASVASASEVLRAAGYRRRLPGENVSPEKYALWQRFAHSTEWWSPATGREVELHSALTDMPSLLHNRRALEHLQTVTIAPQLELTTLAKDSLFAYLCVHGAGHGWSRLKWLADIHALLHAVGTDPSREMTRLYRAADAMGAGRCAAQALLLCEEFFGLALPSTLRAELRKQLVVRLLVRIAKYTMLRGGGDREIYDLPLGTTTIYLARFLLGRGPRFWLREARSRAFPPVALLQTRLPASALALFPLVRFGRWVQSAAHRN